MKTIGRWGLVLATVFILLALSATPLEMAHLGQIRPAFMLIATYYWTILRPSLLPPPVVFVIGLALDVLAVHPFGMNALILVIAQWVSRGQRRFLLGQPFLVMWTGFGLIALGTGILQWALFALFNLSAFSPKPMLVSVLVSTLLFPLMVWPLSIIYKALSDGPSAGS